VLLPCLASAEEGDMPKMPNKAGSVNDYAMILSKDQGEMLEKRTAELEKKDYCSFAVAIIPEIKGFENVEEYSAALFTAWKLGEKKNSRAVLILLAMKEHRIRIEITDNLHDRLTQTDIKTIIGKVAPYLKNSNFAQGIYEGLSEIDKKIEVQMAEKDNGSGSSDWYAVWAVVALLAVISIVMVLRQRKDDV
ncbi:MAG TPA: TPM domain-containing protein, partial [Nitrospirota bacterium]